MICVWVDTFGTVVCVNIVCLCMNCEFVYELWVCVWIVSLCMNCEFVYGLWVCVWIVSLCMNCVFVYGLLVCVWIVSLCKRWWHICVAFVGWLRTVGCLYSLKMKYISGIKHHIHTLIKRQINNVTCERLCNIVGCNCCIVGCNTALKRSHTCTHMEWR